MTPRNLIEPARLAGEAVLRSQSDDRLIDLVRAGNDRAFEAIVHRYRRPLLRYCGRFLTGPRAEDAVQQAFMNAYKAMKADERQIDLRPWLYRIAHNASLNVLRSVSGPVEEPISEEIDGVERPDQAAERRQSLRDVVAAVQALPPRQRDAIVLHELEGRSYDQIATELNVSGGAVRQLLSRARTTLRAGATAIVPEAALARLASAGGDPVATRIAEIVAAGGGAAVVVKVGTAVVVAGAVAVGAAEGPLHDGDPGGRGKQSHREAAVFTGGGTPSVSDDGADPAATVASAAKSSARGDDGRRGESPKRGRHRGRGRGGDDRGEGLVDDRGGDSRSGSGDDGGSHSGSGSSGDGDRSGSSGGGSDDGERSGSGGGGSDDGGRSGSGSGSGGGDDDGALVTQEPDNSGSGSSGSGEGSSGSGSGSGSDDPVVTMPMPDADSSGPGSGDDR